MVWIPDVCVPHGTWTANTMRSSLFCYAARRLAASKHFMISCLKHSDNESDCQCQCQHASASDSDSTDSGLEAPQWWLGDSRASKWGRSVTVTRLPTTVCAGFKFRTLSLASGPLSGSVQNLARGSRVTVTPGHWHGLCWVCSPNGITQAHDVSRVIPKTTTNSIVIWTAKSNLFSCSIHFPPF